MALSIRRRRAFALAIVGAVALTSGIPFLADAGTGSMADMSSTFMPHGMCYLWNPALLALHVGSDAVTAAAYFSIPLLLMYFVRKRPDIPFGAIFWMFSSFIIACGTTHLLDIWTVWHPVYWLSGTVKAVTAAASLTTALMLVPFIPRALNYKSPAQLALHSSRYLRLLADASEALAIPGSGLQLLEVLLDTIVPNIADCAAISLIEPGGVLRTRGARAIPKFAEHAAALLGAACANLNSASPSAVAVRSGKTQVIDSVSGTCRLDEPYAFTFEGLAARYALVVPLMVDDGALGTFLILRSADDSRPFDAAEIVLLETLARRAAMALKNVEHIERLAHSASHDALTGLANRTLLAQNVTAALTQRHADAGELAAVLYIDLDRFKLVNDSLGHATGDLLLEAIARRLESYVRPGDTLARVSGDEFVVLLVKLANNREAQRIGERMVKALTEPFVLGQHELLVTCSIGIALTSMGYASSEEIMRDADIAMYRAKTLGKQRCVIFEPEMRTAARNRMELDIELRHALDRGEFEVYYQPIVALESGALDGFEALVRWRHPTRGMMSPLDFIPIAEETGSIIKLGSLVLRSACMQLARWQEPPANAPLSINVNVSPKQFNEPNYASSVCRILRETGCEPSALHLEITETLLMEERLSLSETFRELRSIGVHIDIDDFGTGYSSLAYLHSFPIDALKIDRSFVSGTDENLANPEIVNTILRLAESLHLSVVAEGVETQAQAAHLRALGCRQAQGYLFSRPLDADAATSYLASFRPSVGVSSAAAVSSVYDAKAMNGKDDEYAPT